MSIVRISTTVSLAWNSNRILKEANMEKMACFNLDRFDMPLNSFTVENTNKSGDNSALAYIPSIKLGIVCRSNEPPSEARRKCSLPLNEEFPVLWYRRPASRTSQQCSADLFPKAPSVRMCFRNQNLNKISN